MSDVNVQEKVATSAKVEEVGPCKYSVSVEISGETVDSKIEEKFQEVAGTVSLPGFRKGKVPRGVLERKYGEDILNDLKVSLLTEAYEEVLSDNDMNPVGEPDVDLGDAEVKPGEPFAFTFTVEVRPTFELDDYEGIEVDRPKAETEKDEIDEQIEALRRQNAELVPVPEKDKIEEGDQIRGDLKLTIGDETVQEQENATVYLNEKLAFFNRPAPQIKDAIVGKKAGDTVTMDLDVPEDATGDAEPYAGKTAVFHLDIKGAKREQLPELDEAFLEKLDMDDEEELREEVEKSILRHKDHLIDHELELAIVQKIVDAADFPLPEGVVDKGLKDVQERAQLDRLMQKYNDLVAEGAKAEDLNFETLREEIAAEVESETDDSRTEIENSIREHLILDYIGTKEKVYITEDEVEARMQAMAQHYGKWPNELRKEFEQRGEMANLRRQMREEKIRTWLREKAKITDVDAPKEEKKPKKKASSKKKAEGKKPAAKKKSAKKSSKKAEKSE
jgi:trigger factor